MDDSNYDQWTPEDWDSLMQLPDGSFAPSDLAKMRTEFHDLIYAWFTRDEVADITSRTQEQYITELASDLLADER